MNRTVSTVTQELIDQYGMTPTAAWPLCTSN